MKSTNRKHLDHLNKQKEVNNNDILTPAQEFYIDLILYHSKQTPTYCYPTRKLNTPYHQNTNNTKGQS